MISFERLLSKEAVIIYGRGWDLTENTIPPQKNFTQPFA